MRLRWLGGFAVTVLPLIAAAQPMMVNPAQMSGIPRPDPQVPAGTITVRLIRGELSNRMVDHAVELVDPEGHIRQAKTDAEGRATFSGLVGGPFVARAREGKEQLTSQPITELRQIGVRVMLVFSAEGAPAAQESGPVSHDISALSIAAGSHLIVQLSEESVEFMAVWRLQNSAGTPVEVPGGLKIALPAGTVSAERAPEGDASFSINAREAVWKGAIKPGSAEVQFAFVIPYSGSSLDVTLQLPIALEGINLVSEKVEGFRIDGDRLESEEREFSGRQLVLYRGPAVAADKSFELHLEGLPHPDRTGEKIAAAVAAACLFGLLFTGQTDDSGEVERKKLVQRKEKLFAELLLLDGAEDGNPSRRADLMAKLTDVYRSLDRL